ncbi:MAG: Sugar phosphate isomerase/epimerase [Verrucomicrobia bacterium]|nr:MAG: Sugar phosphate isomerase/epimerase [Verrucomicrobiota bacterium]
MISTGLVSITFRQLTPAEIVALVSQAGLRGIEWGGDIHVPHGNVACAREVRALTQEAGLAVAAYGSYYRAGASEAAGLSFASVLDTAVELGAPLIRVWAGPAGSASASPGLRAQVVTDLRRIAALAGAARVGVSLEFHNGTLTDTAPSTVQLLAEVDHPNLSTYWQPTLDQDPAAGLRDLRSLLPQLTHVHVFHWRAGTTDRLPLADGAARWRSFLDLAVTAPGDRYAMLEFVEGDAPVNFLRDAATLKSWLNP